MQPALPERIGRFEITGVLGKGAQGRVYLANDPHLERKVAIKTILLKESSDLPRQMKVLLDEARIVSKLQHPNIVALFDAGEESQTPYLVFEYVEGTTLARLLKEQGKLPSSRAVEIAAQMLDGLAYAHQRNIAHRDIKPSNILLDAKGTPRLMDFGIATVMQGEKVGDDAFFGTPSYMAPEYISDKVYTPRSDLFSVGMVLYEMLTGVPAVKGSSIYEVLNAIVNNDFPPPSRKNSEVDEKLDSIVMRAMSKNPANRFESAEQMAKALRNYLSPEEGDDAQSDSDNSALEFLLRRMRHKSDFPALSHTIRTVNHIVSSENEGTISLSNTILKDFALTNKLLKLVNTAYYGQFGGTISTVSRAVVILGFETIRNVAITLLLFEHLQNKSQASQLRDNIVAAYFTGLMAKEMGHKGGIKDAEEAFICAMFHHLGKLLVSFYFHEELVEINKLVQHKKMDENKAAAQVLGISYDELGIGVAKAWNFPDKLVHSMRQITDEQVRKPEAEDERLRVLSSLAHELCIAVRSSTKENRGGKVKELMGKYGRAVPISEKMLDTVVENSVLELTKDASIFNFDVKQSLVYGQARDWPILESQEGNDGVLHTTDPAALSAAASTTNDSPAMLSAGIQDITNALVSDYKLNDILRIILETMYRGMGFSRVLLCIRDPRANSMKGRFGFGPSVDTLVQKFQFSLNYTPDVFHAALKQGVDIHIADVNADKIRERIPDWYRRVIPAQSFIVFPIIVDRKPLGMFYGDKDLANQLIITPKELSLLKTLRNQAVLAIRQKT